MDPETSVGGRLLIPGTAEGNLAGQGNSVSCLWWWEHDFCICLSFLIKMIKYNEIKKKGNKLQME